MLLCLLAASSMEAEQRIVAEEARSNTGEQDLTSSKTASNRTEYHINSKLFYSRSFTIDIRRVLRYTNEEAYRHF
jgi:hypothetical protein